MLKHVRHILKTKGPLLAVRRLFDILARFGFGRRRFRGLLLEFEKVFTRKGIKAAFFVTGTVLDRHNDLVDQLVSQEHCLGVHGQYHVRMDCFSRRAQEKMAASGADLFRKNGLDPRGFRPPYLNYNQDTLAALEGAGYSWTSCRYLLDGNPEPLDGSAGRLDELYHISSLDDIVSVPSFESGLLDIPVTGPDDELMIDRYRISDPAKMHDIWSQTWRRCRENGELYHLMFHPERFALLSPEVRRLIESMEKDQMRPWIASLGEISGWWESRRSVRTELEESDDGIRFVFHCLPDGATVLLSRPGGSSSGQAGDLLPGWQTIPPEAEGEDYSMFRGSGNGSWFLVGLEEGTAPAAEEFLRNEGFITSRSAPSGKCAFRLQGWESFTPEQGRELLAQVEDCPEPLLRLWRWPAGHRYAVTFSADICAIDFWDFVARSWHFHLGER